jgi:CheY-like chemotaxis protein
MKPAMTDSLQLAGGSQKNPVQPASRRKDAEKPLSGFTILIVEDEALLAFDLRDSFEEAGAAIVGPVPSLSGAIRAASEEHFDIAVLDVDLQGRDVFPAAEILVERKIPFLFHTGHGNHSEFPAQFADSPIYPKPGCPSEMIGILLDLIERHRSAH